MFYIIFLFIQPKLVQQLNFCLLVIFILFKPKRVEASFEYKNKKIHPKLKLWHNIYLTTGIYVKTKLCEFEIFFQIKTIETGFLLNNGLIIDFLGGNKKLWFS